MSAGPPGVAPPSSDQSFPSPLLLAGSVTTSSSAPSAPESDSAASGLFLFTWTVYPVIGLGNRQHGIDDVRIGLEFALEAA